MLKTTFCKCCTQPVMRSTFFIEWPWSLTLLALRQPSCYKPNSGSFNDCKAHQLSTQLARDANTGVSNSNQTLTIIELNRHFDPRFVCLTLPRLACLLNAELNRCIANELSIFVRPNTRCSKQKCTCYANVMDPINYLTVLVLLHNTCGTGCQYHRYDACSIEL